jgi:hypothetical protein
MKFTDPEEIKIKARAKQLIDEEGMKPGEAAQKATSELFTQDELLYRFGKPSRDDFPEDLLPGVAPSPQESFEEDLPYGVAPSPVREDKRSDEVKAEDAKLEALKIKFMRERKRQLKSTGLTDEQAEAQAAEEFQEYRKTAPLGYGSPEERESEGGLGLAGDIVEGGFGLVGDIVGAGQAIRRQETPIEDQQASAGINYDELSKYYREELGISKEDADFQVNEIRRQLIEPRIKKYSEEGLSGLEAERKALEESLAVVDGAFKELSGKGLQPDTKGSQDPIIKALSRQTELGKGVPDLNEEEQRLLSSFEKGRMDAAVQAELEKGRTKNVYVNEAGDQIPIPDVGGGPMPTPKGYTPENVPVTEEDIRKEMGADAEDPWWLDPKKKVEVIADPEKFKSRGFFSDETPYGTKKETGVSWMLRTAAGPWNAMSALTAKTFLEDIPISPIALYSDNDIGEGRKQNRTKKGYGEGWGGAILLNVAENRGYFGESLEAAELSGLEDGNLLDKTFYYGTMAGGFAADILDPSLDLFRAAGVAAKAGYKTKKGLDALYDGITFSERAPQVLKNAAKSGASDFAHSHLLGTFLSRKFDAFKFDAGDVRGILVRNLSDDYTAMSIAQRGAAAGDDVVDVVKNMAEAKVGNSLYAKRFSREAGTASEAYNSLKTLLKGSDVEQRIVAINKLLDNPSGISKVIRRKDLARAVGAVAKSDSGIETVLREAQATGKGSKLSRMVTALSNSKEGSTLLTRALASDAALRDVTDATKGMDMYDNVIALTKNTWTGKDAAKEILEKAKGSEISKIVSQLKEPKLIVTRKVKPTFERRTAGTRGAPEAVKTGEAIVVPGYAVAEEQRQVLNRITDELRTYNKISKEEAKAIGTELKEGNISAENLNSLIHANIDLIAEGMAATEKTGITRGRDLARLPVSEQMAVLEPLESRSFGKKAYKTIYSKLTGKVPTEGNMSIGQRELLSQAQVRAASLDQKLLKDLKLMLRDPEFRALYKAKDDVTKAQALSHLIVGPEPKAQKIREAIYDSIADIFYTKEGQENIFDVLTGTSITKNSGILSIKGLESISETVNEVSKQIAENPSRFFDGLDTVIKEVEGIVTRGDKDLLRASPDVIKNGLIDDGLIEAIEKGLIEGKRDGGKETFENIKKGFKEVKKDAEKVTFEKGLEAAKKGFIDVKEDGLIETAKKGLEATKKGLGAARGKIPAEAQIAAYYRRESKAIVDDLMTDLVTKEVGKGQLIVENYFDEEFINKIRGALGQLRQGPPSAKEVIDGFSNVRLVKNRLNKILKGEDLTKITPEDMKDILPHMAAAPKVLQSPAFIDTVQPLFNVAEDIAKGIIRRNKLQNTDLDIAKVEKLFQDVFETGSNEAQLRLLFGEDVYGQLKERYLSGFDSIRQDLLTLMDKKNSFGGEALKNHVSKSIDMFNSARYFAMLNLRPRFHGANLLTGMDIAYKTTGRIVNPLDLAEGGTVLVNRNPNKVIFTDGKGKAWTSGELNEALTTATGRSVYGMEIPGAGSERIASYLKEDGILLDTTNEQLEKLNRRLNKQLKKLNKPLNKHLPSRAPFDVKIDPYDMKISPNEMFETFKELPQSEDLLFRYAIMKKVLNEGRTMDEAIRLAKRSMFDAANLTDAEKSVKKLFLFYGFARNNLVTSLDNMLSVKGWKRTVKAERLRQNVSDIFTDKETREYSPSYAQTRMILDKMGYQPEKGKSLVIAGPPLPSLDGLYGLSEFIKLNPSGILGQAVSPEYKRILGITSKFDREFKTIPPEHIYYLNKWAEQYNAEPDEWDEGYNASYERENVSFEEKVSPADVVNTLLELFGAEPVVPVIDKKNPAAVDGLVYPLNTPKQRRIYKRFFDVLSMAGMTSLLTDIPKSASAEGTKTDSLSLLKKIGFGIGAITPMTYMSPERQAYYDRLSRAAELRKVVSSTKKDEAKRSEAEAPPEDVAKTDEQAANAKAREDKRDAEKQKASSVRQRKRAIMIERDSLKTKKGRKAAGITSRKQLNNRIAELQAEFNDL